MEAIIKKHGFQISLLFSVLVVLLGVAGYSAGEEGLKEMGLVNAPLRITYVMVVIAALLSVGMPLAKALKSPETLKYTLIGFGSVLLILAVTYGMADGTVPADESGTYDGVTSANMKVAGGLVTTAVVLTIAGLVGLVALEVKSIIKK